MILPVETSAPPIASKKPPAVDPLASLRWSFGAPRWLRENPPLLFTLAYVALTIVGVTYTWAFYRRFGVNVLEFAESSDFLMVVMREPVVMGLVLIPVPFYVIYMRGAHFLTSRLRVWWPGFERWMTRHEQRSRQLATPALAFAVKMAFLATYAFLFVLLYSKRQANRVHAGAVAPVTVEFKSDAPRHGAAEWSAILIGTTTRFVFFYDATSRQVEAIPLDSLARIRFPEKVRRGERPAEAAEPASSAATGESRLPEITATAPAPSPAIVASPLPSPEKGRP